MKSHAEDAEEAVEEGFVDVEDRSMRSDVAFKCKIRNSLNEDVQYLETGHHLARKFK